MPQIKVDLQKVVGVWCRIDNWWGWLKHLQTIYTEPNILNHIKYELEKVDIIRHELMQACGFESYDDFVSFIEEKELAHWHESLNVWFVN